jgi:hypothetical protein
MTRNKYYFKAEVDLVKLIQWVGLHRICYIQNR